MEKRTVVGKPQLSNPMLGPPGSEEAETQVSSSSGSMKIASLDGKSVASATTFALDEKESLRPDDSASVMATEDEDLFSPPGSGLPGSRMSSDGGPRPFHDQIREISSMEPSTEIRTPQNARQSLGVQQGVLYVAPQGFGVGPVPTRDGHMTEQSLDQLPDPKLIEALESPKDRIMVLKLQQDIVDFVKDAKESSMMLPQTNAFYRMLAHKLADYYRLGHVVDDSTMALRIFKTPDCRLPPLLTDVARTSTASSTPPPPNPKMKILRRGGDSAAHMVDNGSNFTSKTTSDNGESGNDDDHKFKLPQSREEREARYEAARKRIMGSAKPSESPEAADKDNSRSSSATGKKTNRRKQRASSNDDFEARSAYSAYYPPAYIPESLAPRSYGFVNVADSHSGHLPSAPFVAQPPQAVYQQYADTAHDQWLQQGYLSHNAPAQWSQPQQNNIDLSAEFQRAMSFQQSPPLTQSPYMQSSFNGSYAQRVTDQQQAWSTQGSQMQSYPSQGGVNYTQGHPSSPAASMRFPHEAYGYQYGQLPSQVNNGRPPHALEHPLPGSYRSKHFNPQSQTFIPGQVEGANASTYASQAAFIGYGPYGVSPGTPSTLQRQSSSHSQNSMHASQRMGGSESTGSARHPHQAMNHPLPQPVFPRQPSPKVTLPPKPESLASWPTLRGTNNPAIVTSDGQSGIAKWGAPASLPAKPPPPADAQSSRQPSGSARMGHVMPTFGSMPPVANGYGSTSSSRY